MKSSAYKWAWAKVKEAAEVYKKESGTTYHGETYGVTHFALAGYNTNAPSYAYSRAYLEWLQEKLEEAFPECTLIERFKFPSAHWESRILTLDATNEGAVELAYELVPDDHVDDPRFEELREQYNVEELRDVIDAYTPWYALQGVSKEWLDDAAHWFDGRNFDVATLCSEDVEEYLVANNMYSFAECPKCKFRIESKGSDRYDELDIFDESDEALDYYEDWVQQQTAVRLTPALPGFPRSYVPYRPNNGRITVYHGDYICPHCGTKMKEYV